MSFGEKEKRILQQLGYYGYQQGLIFRHLKQGEGWNSHLQNCRNFILEAANLFKPSVITVLGSGWLLDLPLAELADTAGKIRLVDIVHPPEVKKQASVFKEIEIIEADLTGGLVWEIWERTSGLSIFRKRSFLNKLELPRYKSESDPGMLISLNILSQLDVLPVSRLKKKTNSGEAEINEFRRRIQENHLSFLEGHNSVLISDTAEIFTGTGGEKAEIRTVVIDLPEGKLRKEWIWDFDKKGSDYYEKSSVMKVTAIIL